MTLPVVLRPAAQVEYDAAGDWYEARRPGLGAAFTAAVQTVLDRIAAQPDFYAVTWNGVREGLVSGFPYRVCYREETDQVVVLAIFHTARDPLVWQSRA